MTAIDPTRRLQSVHVPMSDGTRLAVDLWLPGLAAGQRAGTILRATRYHRAAAVAGASPDADSNAAEAAMWAKAGFALVVADARGTGASFGSRASELSEREIADYGELIDWIAGQAWSNGRVGAYGVSYDGDTAELMTRLGNPHLVAAAPLFSDFDPYRQLVYPGGCYTEGAFGRWVSATQVFDGVDGATGRLAARLGLPAELLGGEFSAVKPVDGPGGAALLAQATREHQANADLTEPAARADCRDDRADGVDWDTPSPARWQAAIEASGVPLFVRAGWLDAGTAAGTLIRFAAFASPQEAEIGPWSHGGDTLADPLRESSEDRWLSRDAQDQRLVEFFTRYVKDGERPGGERVLRFTTLGTGDRHTVTTWPPPGLSVRRWFPAAGGGLSGATGLAAAVRFTVDAAATSGESNRWAGNVLGQPVAYPGRVHPLAWTSEPLAGDLHVLGFPVVTLRLATSGEDGAVYVYLEDVGPGDRARYLTEGQLRFTHRATAGPPAPAGLGVPRTFRRADRLAVRPGEPMDLVVELIPVSALIPAGHRLRVAIAGHDAGCFTRYGPDGERFTVLLGDGSYLDLPVMTPGAP